jgi:hypothetical protein
MSLAPLISNGPHSVKDAYAELFERAEGIQIAQGHCQKIT